MVQSNKNLQCDLPKKDIVQGGQVYKTDGCPWNRLAQANVKKGSL